MGFYTSRASIQGPTFAQLIYWKAKILDAKIEPTPFNMSLESEELTKLSFTKWHLHLHKRNWPIWNIFPHLTKALKIRNEWRTATVFSNHTLKLCLCPVVVLCMYRLILHDLIPSSNCSTLTTLKITQFCGITNSRLGAEPQFNVSCFL